MSSTAETSQQPTPTPHSGFDPIEFWYLHKTKIIALGAMFAVALVSYAVYSVMETKATEAANEAYAASKTTDDFKKVIAEHPNQAAAGNAALRVADNFRKEGKLEEANNVLRGFIEKNSQHPLIAGAHLALAQNLEAASKLDEALPAYQRIQTSYPSSYAVPFAMVGQGRIEVAKGQVDAAKATFEKVVSQYPGTSFGMDAQTELATLKKKNPDAPAPAPTDAPKAPSAGTPVEAPKPADAATVPAAAPAPADAPKPDAAKAPEATQPPAADPAKPVEAPKTNEAPK